MLTLLKHKLTASTINQHIVAFGTFASWVNLPRPRTEMIAYILKGEAKDSGPPPKVRVHDFPFAKATSRVAEVLMARPTERVPLMYCCTAMLLVLWPVRPITLASCKTVDVYM